MARKPRACGSSSINCEKNWRRTQRILSTFSLSRGLATVFNLLAQTIPSRLPERDDREPISGDGWRLSPDSIPKPAPATLQERQAAFPKCASQPVRELWRHEAPETPLPQAKSRGRDPIRTP